MESSSFATLFFATLFLLFALPPTPPVTDLSQIISVTKEFGFKNFVDYASAAPYLPINVNVPGSEVDAAFISPHKFLGGPGSSGILIIKKDLIPQTTPVTHQSGGGTVFYVTSSSHRFLSNRVERNEGGSPNIPSLIRAGLAFLLKRKVGTDYITSTDKRRRYEGTFEFTSLTRAETLTPFQIYFALTGQNSSLT